MLRTVLGRVATFCQMEQNQSVPRIRMRDSHEPDCARAGPTLLGCQRARLRLNRSCLHGISYSRRPGGPIVHALLMVLRGRCVAPMGLNIRFTLRELLAKMAQKWLLIQDFCPFITHLNYMLLRIQSRSPRGILGKNKAFNSFV
jgi:hypothetical protein